MQRLLYAMPRRLSKGALRRREPDRRVARGLWRHEWPGRGARPSVPARPRAPAPAPPPALPFAPPPPPAPPPSSAPFFEHTPRARARSLRPRRRRPAPPGLCWQVSLNKNDLNLLPESIGRPAGGKSRRSSGAARARHPPPRWGGQGRPLALSVRVHGMSTAPCPRHPSTEPVPSEKRSDRSSLTRVAE